MTDRDIGKDLRGHSFATVLVNENGRNGVKDRDVSIFMAAGIGYHKTDRVDDCLNGDRGNLRFVTDSQSYIDGHGAGYVCWWNKGQTHLGFCDGQFPVTGDRIKRSLAESSAIRKSANLKRSGSEPLDLTTGEVVPECLGSATVTVDGEFQSRPVGAQIEGGSSSERVIELIDRGVIADRVWVVEKCGAKICAVPTNQIDDVTCSYKVDGTTACPVDQIDYREGRA